MNNRRCATASDRIEWYLNNTRMRYAIAPSKHSLLPSGTSANEALYAEINNWFRQVRMMHQATLTLKLRVLTLSKQLSHNAALYSPTTRQMPNSVVLARVASRPLWSREDWKCWCGGLRGTTKIYKANHVRFSPLRFAQT